MCHLGLGSPGCANPETGSSFTVSGVNQVKEKELRERRGRVGKGKGEILHWQCSPEGLPPFRVEAGEALPRIEIGTDRSSE